MSEYTIEIEGLPEGWEAVAFRPAKLGESYCDRYGTIKISPYDSTDLFLIVQKSKPRRIVLEETGDFREAYINEFYQLPEGRLIQHGGSARPTADKYKIWREVKEE